MTQSLTAVDQLEQNGARAPDTLFYKRLDRGTFRLPEPLEPEGRSVVLDERALDDLLDGIDVEAAPKRTRKKREPPLH